MALLCSRKVNLLSGKMGSQILSTVGQCQLYSHPLCLRWWFQSGATIRQYTTSTYYVERLLGEWNTILLTPVNRWLYDCLFLLVEEGKIWPPLPDFYDPESTFVTECCRSPNFIVPVHPQWSSGATTTSAAAAATVVHCKSLVKLTCQSWETFSDLGCTLQDFHNFSLTK